MEIVKVIRSIFIKMPWLLLFLVFFTACSQTKPVKIGFVSDLSSRNSAIGIQARNGLNMAIEEINSNGGIRGRKLEAIIGNHKGETEVCTAVVRDLITRGSNIIIGPMVSGMASTVISAAEESGILVIGPTVSTDALSGIDDNFLRIVATASSQGNSLASSVLSLDNKNLVLILDKKNIAYTRAVSEGFHNKLKNTDIQIADDIYFENKDEFQDIVEQLEMIKPDAIVFSASGIDTAGIIQLYAKHNEIPQLYGSSWVKVTNVIDYGGKTVEGMIIIDSFENPEPIKREREFTRKFRDLFGTEPNIAARSVYETVYLYVQAFSISKSLKSSEIKKTILDMEIIEGIDSEFHLDKYGDGVRKLSFFVVENGRYKLKE